MDPWQQHVLEGALGERPDGSWVTPDVTLIVSRQNGKGSILEALVLAWLFLFGEQKILFSAHEMKTAAEMFKRIRDLIKASDELHKQVAHFYASNERTSIELVDGRECRFMARSKGSGRGFSAQKIVFDEAYNLPDDIHDAQKPTTGAMEQPQTWYTSSAGDKDIAPCDVLARMRRLGLAKDPNVAFFEWSVPYDERTLKMAGDPADPKLWAIANPSMGIRKRDTTIAGFQRTMSPNGFAREELGIGNWPDPESGDSALSYSAWLGLADPKAQRGANVVFGVDVDQSRGAWISIGWRRPDGHTHFMMDGDEPIPAYAVTARCKDLAQRWGGKVVPPRAFEQEMVEAGIPVHPMKATDFHIACGAISDALDEGTIHHGNQASLNTSVRVARWRSVGTKGEKEWQFKDCPEIGPLAAMTRAFHGLPATYDVLMSAY